MKGKQYEVWYRMIVDDVVERHIATALNKDDADWICEALYSFDKEMGEEDTSEYYSKEVGKSK